MNATPSNPGKTAETAQTVRDILSRLKTMIILFLARDPRLGDWIPIHNYINRTMNRFASLLLRMDAGPLKIRVRAPSTAKTERKTPRLSFSRKRNWLGAIFGWQCRHLTSHLENLLSEPGLAARLAQTPQASRLLRPLCRMLHITLPWLAPLPPRKRQPRPPAARKPRAPTRAELRKILWYPNSEGKPMDLLPPRKKRA